ncbi:peptidase [Xanthomonas citri pv. citri str. 306]|uniref:Peptidase n=2 Tax=Xanthomonas citri TaxID=346 RepID=A0AAI8EU11_XANAC|nr:MULTISPECIES: PA domain-containing protein [Xanthomonas]AAM38455.1 peptidase [Xanthomonas citri pv. citri str. 306]AKM26513.1 peptidase [Xanthomonas citri pv. citri]OOW54826.1 peptidase [Xanthomonas citri pv. citri]PWE97627.1 peptidase [Xanthomonas citri pv. citri]PWE97892.1 peptidase [Xanthomonas citri pv. citri]
MRWWPACHRFERLIALRLEPFLQGLTMTSSQHAWLIAMALAAPSVAAQSAAQPAAHAGALPGYDAAAAQAQRALEARFDDGLKDADYRGWLKQWSSAPNQVGAPHNLVNARDLQTRLRDYGWDARIETFEVLWPSPRSSQLELLGPKPYIARLKEPPLAGDNTSTQTEHVLPPYVIYGGNGDVTGDLVYVNYGIAEDYEALARNGVDVRGKIVIARYGKGWRGLKPRLAQEHGAIGAIIYSDPRDDGYFQDQAYPDGPAQSVERATRLGCQLRHLPRRSADAGRGRKQGRQAPEDRTGRQRVEDPDPADQLGRRTAAAGRVGRPGSTGRLARRLADHLPHRRRCKGTRASEGGCRLGQPDHLQRHRHLARQ